MPYETGSQMAKAKKSKIKLCSHGINHKFCAKCAPEKTPLSADQQLAVDQIKDGYGPFFLTGPGGSGKTYVIKHLQNLIPDTIVCAMTGIAGQLIGGKTAHSILGIHPTYGVGQYSKANRRLEGCSLLIIDEISMASAEFLGQIYERFDIAGCSPKTLFVGDFLQLPPVNGTKIFTSPDWLMRVKMLRLEQQHRQHDAAFITALNEIRVGELSQTTLNLFGQRVVNELPKDCVHLLSRRNAVEEGNLTRLDAIQKVPRIYYREETRIAHRPKDSRDEERIVRSIEKALGDVRFPKILQVKDGARVVLLNNTEDWVNGSTGEIVDMTDEIIRVRLDVNGKVVSVGPVEEELSDEDGMAICKISQFPILLAWAMTIHKAQGMTLDRVGIDLRGHFETGQTYVALSRCKYFDGLYLAGNFGKILVDHEAIEYLESKTGE